MAMEAVEHVTSLRILLVDDQEAVRRGLRSLLSSRADWSICGEAEDGADAVAKAKALRPDVVLMDVSMPRMNGLDATRIIRRELPESKVVIVSQNDPAVVRRQTREIDAAAYVDKANLSRALLPTIDRCLGNGDSKKSDSNSMAGNEGLDTSTQEVEECAVSTRLPTSALLNLAGQAYLMDLLPIAAYAVRAPPTT
jgi:DNA-binding NarL/FixJ family response regulator